MRCLSTAPTRAMSRVCLESKLLSNSFSCRVKIATRPAGLLVHGSSGSNPRLEKCAVPRSPNQRLRGVVTRRSTCFEPLVQLGLVVIQSSCSSCSPRPRCCNRLVVLSTPAGAMDGTASDSSANQDPCISVRADADGGRGDSAGGSPPGSIPRVRTSSVSSDSSHGSSSPTAILPDSMSDARPSTGNLQTHASLENANSSAVGALPVRRASRQKPRRKKLRAKQRRADAATALLSPVCTRAAVCMRCLKPISHRQSIDGFACRLCEVVLTRFLATMLALGIR